MIACLLAMALVVASPVQTQLAGEVVAAVRVQGNVLTPDEEIVRLAGITIGMPVATDTVEAVARRLRAARKFDRVEVLKRYASISDPTQIVLVVLVNEGAVSIKRTGDPDRPTRVVRSWWPNLLVLPIFSNDDEYGPTYGARITRPNTAGRRGRVSFPVTWGGTKRGAVEFEKRYDEGWLTRLTAGASISRRTRPSFGEDDDRQSFSVRAERDVRPWLRLGATGGWQHVSFLDTADRFTDFSADLIVDTRLDPWLARNAVFARIARRRLDFHGRDTAAQTDLEAHGYLGIFGQSVLVASARKEGSDGPLPEYLKPLLGGASSVRGFKAGTGAGDNLVTGSLELRVPLTSPLRLGKIGVAAFIDAGTVYDDGERFADQVLKRGAGGGVWFAATVFRFNVSVARGSEGLTRVHATGNLRF